MKFKKVTNYMETNGTSLMGHFNGDYSDIVRIFGEPHDDGDGYKVDAEWRVKFADGTIACIYNYKDGKNYCGDDGLDVDQITDWHIGGFNKVAVDRVKEVLA